MFQHAVFLFLNDSLMHLFLHDNDKRLVFLSTTRPQDLISKEEQSSDGTISNRSAYWARPSNISIFELVAADNELT